MRCKTSGGMLTILGRGILRVLDNVEEVNILINVEENKPGCC